MNWAQRIKKATKVGGFSARDYALVGEWDTCAVGEAHAAQPLVVAYNSITHEPVDGTIWRLGLDFATAVQQHNVAHADYLHAAIQERARELALQTQNSGEDDQP